MSSQDTNKNNADTLPSRHPFYKRLMLVNIKYQLQITGYAIFTGFAMTLFALHYQKMQAESEFSTRTQYFYIGFSIVIFLAIIFLGFYITNRFVGPVYRIQNHLEKWKQTGIWQPLKVRRQDQLTELVDVLNENIERITKK